MPRTKTDTFYRKTQRAYARLGVDTDRAIQRTLETPISIHCWQADDVRGFENSDAGGVDSGGLLATGNHPGRARNGQELRHDLDLVMSLAPGAHRVNLHALYAETGGEIVDRDRLEPRHFERWMCWAQKRRIGLDFNTSNFAHPKAADGMTLSHPDRRIRQFWIRHGIACRRIATAMGRATGQPCGLNHWIPDGTKDSPIDRWAPRARLVRSLDSILAARAGVSRRWCRDSVEGKLFGIGSEDFVVGSFEFYQGFALSRGIDLCLDMGHFHPTETIHDKLSALLCFHPKLLIHMSRALRWDSDHVVVLNDDLRAVFQELVRGEALGRVRLALDYFDASINRIGAYVIGLRAARKALLYALLEPVEHLRALEAEGRGAEKLAWLDDLKALPWGDVWNQLCRRAGTPLDMEWISLLARHEQHVLMQRQSSNSDRSST